MNLTDLAIRHRLTVYVLMALIVVAGVSAYTSLPVESFPEVQIPLILVSTSYLGVSPADMETLVTRQLETEIRSISGIKEIRSTSSEGFSMIEVEFNPEIQIETALQRVRDKVDIAKSDLPPDIDDDPRVEDIDLSQIPVIIISLSGDIGLVQLKEIAEDLKDELEAFAGVNRVEVIGGREREVHVFADPRRLASYELGLTDLVFAVSRENLTVPGGEIDVGRLKYLVRIPAEVERPGEIEDFVVKVRNGVPVYVKDVAHVAYGFEDETTRSRLNRQPAVSLTVEKRTGANIIEVVDRVKVGLAELQDRLPEGVTVTLVADQSVEIRAMVSELENNILAGLILVILVLMAFLGFRNSLFVAVALPLSMLITFFCVQAVGYTLNMVVLFSMILVVGMLVDNAVVIVENIYRHRELGEDGETASSRATSEVVAPVIVSTITTCFAFAPLLFWPGIIGDFFAYLPATVILGLSASLLVALVFNPALCAALMKAPPPRPDGAAPSEGRFLIAYRRLLRALLEQAPDHGSPGWFVRNWLFLGLFGALLALGLVAALLGFALEQHTASLLGISGLLMLLAGLAFVLQGTLWLVGGTGRRLLGWGPSLTDRRAGTLWSMGAILVGTFVIYGVAGRGAEFFPEVDPREIWIEVEVPSGTNLDTSDAIVTELEARTGDTSDLEYGIASVGSQGVSLSDFSFGSVGTRSRVTLDLLDHKDRKQSSRKTIEQVRERVAGISGAEIKVDKPSEGPPTGKPVTIRVVGDDFTRLGAVSRQIQDRITSVPGLVNLDDDFDEGRPEIRLVVDRTQAMVQGVSTSAIATTVQTAIRGVEASEYRVGEDEYDIRVRLRPESRVSIDELENLTVPDEDGVPIPIRNVARLETGVGPGAIRRVDLRRVVTIEGDVLRAPRPHRGHRAGRGGRDPGPGDRLAGRLPVGVRRVEPGGGRVPALPPAGLRHRGSPDQPRAGDPVQQPDPPGHGHALRGAVAHRRPLGSPPHGDTLRHRHDRDRRHLTGRRRRQQRHRALRLHREAPQGGPGEDRGRGGGRRHSPPPRPPDRRHHHPGPHPPDAGHQHRLLRGHDRVRGRVVTVVGAHGCGGDRRPDRGHGPHPRDRPGDLPRPGRAAPGGAPDSRVPASSPGGGRAPALSPPAAPSAPHGFPGLSSSRVSPPAPWPPHRFLGLFSLRVVPSGGVAAARISRSVLHPGVLPGALAPAPISRFVPHSGAPSGVLAHAPISRFVLLPVLLPGVPLGAVAAARIPRFVPLAGGPPRRPGPRTDLLGLSSARVVPPGALAPAPISRFVLHPGAPFRRRGRRTDFPVCPPPGCPLQRPGPRTDFSVCPAPVWSPPAAGVTPIFRPASSGCPARAPRTACPPRSRSTPSGSGGSSPS